MPSSRPVSPSVPAATVSFQCLPESVESERHRPLEGSGGPGVRLWQTHERSHVEQLGSENKPGLGALGRDLHIVLRGSDALAYITVLRVGGAQGDREVGLVHDGQSIPVRPGGLLGGFRDVRPIGRLRQPQRGQGE